MLASTTASPANYRVDVQLVNQLTNLQLTNNALNSSPKRSAIRQQQQHTCVSTSQYYCLANRNNPSHGLDDLRSVSCVSNERHSELVFTNVAETENEAEEDGDNNSSGSDISTDSLMEEDRVIMLSVLPPTLLQDIRDNVEKLPESGDSLPTSWKSWSGGSSSSRSTGHPSPSWSESEDVVMHPLIRSSSSEKSFLEDVREFYLKENEPRSLILDEKQACFGGYKDIFLTDGSFTIRSDKGTIRGVRNRVRQGIATFLQPKTHKSYMEREHGKVVVYVTSLGVVRDTYQRCLKVKRILRTLLVKIEERDIFMSHALQQEIKERMGVEKVQVPQVYLEGQHLGDAETIEKLNESGELRKMLRPYKRVGPVTVCERCGGYQYLPCAVCNGSKKSVHRNHFTTEFVALKCMNCDESGLVQCEACREDLA